MVCSGRRDVPAHARSWPHPVRISAVGSGSSPNAGALPRAAAISPATALVSPSQT